MRFRGGDKCIVCCVSERVTRCCLRCQTCCWAEPDACPLCAPFCCTLCGHEHTNTEAGYAFCAWMSRRRYSPTCFVCGREVPRGRMMACVLCDACED
jgi:hypothetical protein